MGRHIKSERIGDMFRLLWLEHVITEASLMTRSIKLHSMLELDVLSIAGLGVCGAAPPSQNQIFF